MNRLKMMLVGAALITGGSALASAQVVQQNVAFRDHDRDRDRDRDRARDRGYNNYRVYRDHDRDDRRYVDRDWRYERGYNNGYYNRRWDGHRWLYWNGYEWVY
jgi:Ni/Co efflux regulator RcnB